MRSSVILALLILYLVPLDAMCIGITYYVDAVNGNDRNNGLASDRAWKTIAKVNGRSFRPGDYVLFKRGQVWREKLIIQSSGNSGYPITFGSYGTGEKPEINGADIITGWSLYKDNIYMTEFDSEVIQLFVDRQRQVKARWPNSGWLPISADSTNKISLRSGSLVQPINYWAGATIVMKTQPYWIEVRTVVSNTGHIIQWDDNVEYGTPAKNYGFFLEGKLEEIDRPGEWCYSEGRVYLMMTDGDNPDNHLIEGSVRDTGIEIPGMSYVVIEGIGITYPYTNGINITYPDHIYVRDNAILFTEQGIVVYSPGSPYDYLYINDNLISQTYKDGISIWGSNHCEITNNELIDIASDESSPRVGNGIWIANADHLLISGNSIERVSYNGIYACGGYTTISRNVVSNCLLLLTDGGGIYTAVPSANTSITNNIINGVIGNAEATPFSEEDGGGVGIYLDEVSSGYTVGGNIVYDCYYGMVLHRAYNNTIVNNSFYNNTNGLALEERNPNEMHDNNIYNNIFLCTKPDQITWHESTDPESTSKIKGMYDYNLHYNPYRNRVIEHNSRLYTLGAWKTFSGQDEHSITEDPLFIDVMDQDFRLQPFSPCIDTGTDTRLTQDFEGNPIPQGIAPDIGAFEFANTNLLRANITQDDYFSAFNQAAFSKRHIVFFLQFNPAVEAGFYGLYAFGLIPLTVMLILATSVISPMM